MGAQIVAHQHKLVPPRARRLHEMNMVRPGTWSTFSKQHFARQPCFVYRHIPVTQRLERLDGGRARFAHVEDPTRTSMIGFAASPGTAVLPTCSIVVTIDPRAARRRVRSRSNWAGQVGS